MVEGARERDRARRTTTGRTSPRATSRRGSATKCHEDPSLAVAHGCFWELHPAKAYAWELRLQDEIRPDFTIDEPGSDEARAAFLKGQEPAAREIEAKERKRREKKGAKEEEQTELAYDAAEAEEGTDE